MKEYSNAEKHTKNIFQIYLLLTLLQNSSWASDLVFLWISFLPEK